MKRATLALAVLLIASVGFATTVVPMSVERLTQASTHVVIGQAMRSWSEWNQHHTQIFTYTRFRVSRILKGNAPREIVVKQMGGRAGGFEQKVAGVRPLMSGEQALLFVHPSQAADGTLVITGLMQGNFRIIATQKGEVLATNDVPGVNQLRAGANSVEHYSGSRMPLSTLESLVNGVVRRGQP
jgi:hypothetical protein